MDRVENPSPKDVLGSRGCVEISSKGKGTTRVCALMWIQMNQKFGRERDWNDKRHGKRRGSRRSLMRVWMCWGGVMHAKCDQSRLCVYVCRCEWDVGPRSKIEGGKVWVGVGVESLRRKGGRGRFEQEMGGNAKHKGCRVRRRGRSGRRREAAGRAADGEGVWRGGWRRRGRGVWTMMGGGRDEAEAEAEGSEGSEGSEGPR